MHNVEKNGITFINDVSSDLPNGNPAGTHLFKVNNGNTKAVCKKCSKLTVRRRFVVFIVNFEQISLIVLVFPLLTLNKQMLTGKDCLNYMLLVTFQRSICNLENYRTVYVIMKILSRKLTSKLT